MKFFQLQMTCTSTGRYVVRPVVQFLFMGALWILSVTEVGTSSTIILVQ